MKRRANVSRDNRTLGLRLAAATALRYLTRSRARTVAAIVAAALGAGVLAASSVLTNSAHAEVTQQFLDLRSTRLVATSNDGRTGWATAQQVADTARLPGVRAACSRTSSVGTVLVRKSLPSTSNYTAPIYAISAGCFPAMGMLQLTGRDFTAGDRVGNAHTVVLGSAVASALGLTTLTGDDRIYLGTVPYAVAGVVYPGHAGDVAGALNVYLPSQQSGEDAVTGWRNSEVIVNTQPAATDAVASALPLSLEPADPRDVFVLVGDIPTGLQSAVSDQLSLLLAALGVLSAVIGLFVIGNQTLQSVGLRRPEIALRRALGQPRHVVVTQVMIETTLCGAIGGFLGSLVGELVAAIVASYRGWPPIADIRLIPLSALVGAVIGALAGAYPARIASATDPATTLKTG